MIDEPLSGTMHSLYILLLGAFTRNKAHVWLLNRCTDGFGIIAIVLLSAAKGADVLRCHDLY